MEKLKVLDLFSGIGGFSLGLERTGGFETIAFCEIEKFPQKVLAKHWPGIKIYEDVRNVTARQLAADGLFPDVITGGFPCQDISSAGKQAGIAEGTRSGLWSECARLLGDIRPKYAIFENVTALLNGQRGDWFKRVLWDISQVGYDAEWHCIRAGTAGLPQQRDRIWIVAYPNKIGRNASIFEDSLVNKKGSFREWEQVELYGTRSGNARWLPVARDWRMGDGVPSEMDVNRFECCGNSVVPQIPELIGMAILESERNA